MFFAVAASSLVIALLTSLLLVALSASQPSFTNISKTSASYSTWVATAILAAARAARRATRSRLSCFLRSAAASSFVVDDGGAFDGGSVGGFTRRAPNLPAAAGQASGREDIWQCGQHRHFFPK